MKLEIDDNRHLVLVGSITGDTASDAVIRLQELHVEDPESPIYLTICSQGGDLSPALWLADFIQYLGTTVIGIAAGSVHSSAITIFCACTVRYSYKSTGFFTHPAAFDMSVTDHAALVASSDEYNFVHKACEAIELPAFSKLNKSQYENIAYKATFFNAKEAYASGLVEGILE